MPRKPIDYFNTIMYKIVCNDLSILDCYVGSTTDFTRRKCNHKNLTKTSNRRLYEFIRENGGWNNWTMVQIEEYPCMNSNQKTKRERYWFEELKASLNTLVPNRGIKEYHDKFYIDNREKILEKVKEYNKNNKEKINAYQKNYYIIHKA